MALATAESIRDRIAAVLVGLTPTLLSSDKFRQYRAEAGANFEEFITKSPAGAFRRFHVREVGEEENPLTSNTTEERLPIEFELLIAYPQTHRYGPGNALDRDDVARRDWRDIKHAIGIDARANFTSATDGSYDATPLGATRTRETMGANDVSVIRVSFEHLRSTTA
jgi:hypothetical protein